MNDKERIVKLAHFSFPEDALIPMTILREEGIECYLRNAYSSPIFTGGAALEIMESERERASEIMKNSGYEQYLCSER